ncbi:MAG: oligosaccharide flippase family protein [Microcoleaceae cyanobacterium]
MNLFKSLKGKITQVSQKALVRDTLWLFLSKFINIFIQATYFILVARSLGTEGFGIFSGTSALASIMVPFATLGSGDLLIQSVSRDRSSFRESWGKALIIVSVASVTIIFLLLFIAKLFLLRNVPLIVILLILIADVLGVTLTFNLAARAFMAMNLIKRAAQVQVFLSFSKFVAAIILTRFFPDPNIIVWSYLYCFSTLIASFSSILLVCKLLGRPKFSSVGLTSKLDQGLYFAISESASTINANIDKTMLVSLSTAEAAGIYAAAYRLIDVGSIPIFAMLGATYARFFEHGISGIKGSLSFAKRLLPGVAAYGMIAGLGLFILAPFVPSILGEEYVDAVSTLRWLSPVPFLIGVQYMAADSLTGAGFQRSRSIVQVSTAALNVSLNFILIPQYSWKGAIWATLCSEILKVILLWIIVTLLYRKQQRAH